MAKPEGTGMTSTLTDRTDRTMETRDAESREYRYRPPEELPEPDPVAGFEHRWVRLSVLGESDPQNVAKRRYQGYEPVKAAEQPRLCKMLGVNPNAETIEFGGLQLNKIPTFKANAIREYFSGETAKQERSVKQHFEQGAGQVVPSMPLINENATQARRGNRFGSGE